METFQEAGVQMLKEFRALLQHSPLPLPGTRLLQLLALNMFAIETTQLKGKSEFFGILRIFYFIHRNIIYIYKTLCAIANRTAMYDFFGY